MAVTNPTLPTSTPSPTYNLPTGKTTHTCNTAGDFTSALANCIRGDVIVLTAGNTFAGTFTLPDLSGRTDGGTTDWVYIISSGIANLPEGTRVSASATNMPTITVTSDAATIQTANSADYYWLAGLHIKNTSTVQLQNSIVNLRAASTPSNVDNAPDNIVLDRCWITGDDTYQRRRGVRLDGTNLSVIDCYIDNIWDAGADTQAILSTNGAGPLLIRNNYLEASGENVMFGGGDPNVTNLVPSDITMTRNLLEKRSAWMLGTGSGKVIKNSFELKNAKRVLIEGNYFQNNCVGDGQQKGHGIVITPRNQDGGASWSTVEDVTFQYNKILYTERGFNISNGDSDQTSQSLARIKIEHNLYVMRDWGVGGDQQCAINLNHSGSYLGEDIQLLHNTIVYESGETLPYGAFMQNSGILANAWDEFYLIDNIFFSGTGNKSGFNGTDLANFDDFVQTTYSVTNNAVYEEGEYNPPDGAGTNWQETTLGNIGFTDYPNGDYSLSSGNYVKDGSRDATDAEDLGADIDTIESKYAGTGGGSSPTVARSGKGVSFGYFR